jgi:formate--tetrahydrofolate ligase
MESTGFAAPRDIREVAAELGWQEDDLVVQGPHRAKVRVAGPTPAGGPRGRYVLVTGTTPTAAGEGKTVTTISAAMGLARLGLRSVATLRQSSLGPTLGSKGGGAGGGEARLEPLAEALLGLGADLFAVESANNLLAAWVDDLLARPDPGIPIDPAHVMWRRVLDMDDRALRSIGVTIDGPDGPWRRETGFDITAASEVMAVLSLATDLGDLRERLARIVVAYDRSGGAVTAEAVGAAGALAVLLRDALGPNLLQTSEGTPALVHGGPFANIAHGCSSVIADQLALARADVVITEAGFGADLGAEKFLHLKCAASGLAPDAAVLVTTVRALADHGERLGGDGPTAALVEAGAVNLRRHVANLVAFGLPVVVAVNRFPGDDHDAFGVLTAHALAAGALEVVPHDGFARGGAGSTDLAEAVLRACEQPAHLRPRYRPSDPIREKVRAVATSVYGAGDVVWSAEADDALARLEGAGYGHLPICIAKTHRSFTHDPSLAGAPTGWTLPVRDVRLRAGAGFVTVYAGAILTMPGFPRRPRFRDLSLDDEGGIVGLV